MDEEPLRRATNFTGRASALLFLPVFIARPLVDIFGAARFGKLLRKRAFLGLTLAGNHHVHMILLTVLLVGEGAGITAFIFNPGLYIYGVLILMNITSFTSVKRRLSAKTINRIHWIGLYALAAAFFETLILSVFMGVEGGAFRWVYTGLFFTALGIRGYAGLKQKRA